MSDDLGVKPEASVTIGPPLDRVTMPTPGPCPVCGGRVDAVVVSAEPVEVTGGGMLSGRPPDPYRTFMPGTTVITLNPCGHHPDGYEVRNGLVIWWMTEGHESGA